jgi:hypothetical protein
MTGRGVRGGASVRRTHFRPRERDAPAGRLVAASVSGRPGLSLLAMHCSSKLVAGYPIGCKLVLPLAGVLAAWGVYVCV